MKKQVHNVHFCLVGALLHTSFNSRTRPWELRSVDGIDLFDVFCSSVRYETRKNGLMRAISASYIEQEKAINFNKFTAIFSDLELNYSSLKASLNFKDGGQTKFTWLNDRARYFLDFVEKQRIYSPSVQGHSLVQGFSVSSELIEWIPRSVSWVVAINYLKKEFYFSLFIENFSVCNLSRVEYDRYSFIGNFTDSFSLLNFKFFSTWLGFSGMFSNLNFSNFLNSDFRSSFLLDRDSFFSSDCVVLVGLDLRLENPTFNLRLKDYVESSSLESKPVQVFSFGNLVNPIYRARVLGTTIFSFLNFLNGRHIFCNVSFRFFEHPFFLLGYGLFEVPGLLEKFRNGLSNIFELGLFRRIDYAYFSRYITSITAYEFGFQPGVNSAPLLLREDIKSFFNNPLKFFFFFCYNSDFNFLLPSFFKDMFFSNFFVVYQGTHFTELAINANVILPSDFVLDRNSRFLNIEGKLISIFNNFKYNMHYINDYDFFKFFLAYCREDFKYSLLKSDFLIFFPFFLQNTVSNFLTIFLNSFFDKMRKVSTFSSLVSFKFSNSILGGTVYNFFLSEPVCRVSRSMILASKSNLKILKKRKYNYEF